LSLSLSSLLLLTTTTNGTSFYLDRLHGNGNYIVVNVAAEVCFCRLFTFFENKLMASLSVLIIGMGPQ
jgi:hypothetical protein